MRRRYPFQVPDPWPSRAREALGKARCKVIGHPRRGKWQRKMYGRICPSCRTFERTHWQTKINVRFEGKG